MTSADVAHAFKAACHAELLALKPGNVHVYAPGHGMEAAHFIAAADAAAPFIAATGLKVGARIEAAVTASMEASGLNTNLGILLLAAPLAQAALAGGRGDLHTRLAHTLDTLDQEDAILAFRAIALANPGGLGTAEEADVRLPPRLTLKDAMALAAHRDLIARQYANGFRDVFDIGLSRLKAARGAGRPLVRGTTAPAEQRLSAAELAYLDFLAIFPDSHIARKFGAEMAQEVRREAEAVAATLADLSPADAYGTLLAFDADLKVRGLNPGTSADLTVASLFALFLEEPATRPKA